MLAVRRNLRPARATLPPGSRFSPRKGNDVGHGAERDQVEVRFSPQIKALAASSAGRDKA